jgi:predicted nuclease of predicted toxin-antitoxin system
LLAEWLASKGHDCVETRSIGADPGDEAILEWANREARVLITADKDFGKLVVVDGKPHCGVVRLPQVPHEHRIELMAEILEKYSSDLERGVIITVKGHRIRVSRTANSG